MSASVLIQKKSASNIFFPEVGGIRLLDKVVLNVSVLFLTKSSCRKLVKH